MYDPKCHQLSVAFLEDHPKVNTQGAREELAQEIQDTIESYIAGLEAEKEPEPRSYDDALADSFRVRNEEGRL